MRMMRRKEVQLLKDVVFKKGLEGDEKVHGRGRKRYGLKFIGQYDRWDEAKSKTRRQREVRQ